MNRTNNFENKISESNYLNNNKPQPPRKTNVVIVIIFVAAALLICVFWRQLSLMVLRLFGDQKIQQFLTCIGLIAAGAVITVVYPLSRRKAKKRCTHYMMGTVVDLLEVRNGDDGKVIWKPVYEYKFNGKVYKGSNKFGIPENVNVYQSVPLMINPDNPTEFYHAGVKNKELGGVVVIGIVLLVIGAILLFVTIRV